MDARHFMADRVPRTRPYLRNSEILRALGLLLKQGTGPGRLVEHFEHEFSSLHEFKGAVTCSYARMSLYYILQALKLPPDSEVIVTPITIHDIINIIILSGHKPVFADIDPRTYQMDPLDLQRKVTKNTRAVLVTHLFGMPADMRQIMPICNRHDLIVLEDASHSYNSSLDGRFVGTFGLAGFFSLSSLKSISSGYGGVIISRDEGLLKTVRDSVKTLPACPKKELWDVLVKNLVIGMATNRFFFNLCTFPAIRFLNAKNPDIVQRMQTDNPRRTRLAGIPEKWLWRFGDVQAALALHCLQRLADVDDKRRRHAQILFDELMPVAADRLPQLLPGSCNVYWRFPFRAPEKSAFQRYMNKHGVDTTSTLLPCCSTEPAFDEYSAPTPNAERAVKEIYFLPVEPALNELQVLGIARAVKAFIKAGA
jgi:perosamine synthetase